MGRTKKPRDGAAKPPRPPDEVKAAIRGLSASASELRRWMRVAELLMAGVRWTGLTQSHEDLFLEVLVKALSGRRPWRYGVSLDQYLYMSMRSVRTNWVKHQFLEGNPEAGRKALIDAEEGGQVSELLEALIPDPERVAAAREELSALKELFSSGIEAGILEGWSEDMTEGEICAKLGISGNEYHAARKRMKPRLRLFRGKRQ